MTYYELLDVPTTSDDQAIKRAWARLVRLYPPDSDAEMNQKLNEAKSTLLDPIARADYDAQLQYGEEIDELFQEGRQCLEGESYEGAIRAFKEVLALHPKSFAARNLLGLAYSQQGKSDDAVRQFERLTSEAPTSALYAANFGHILKEIAGREKEAEKWFLKAISLESFNAEHHLSLSRLYVAQSRYTDAEAAIEGAVAADGHIDIGDIDALMELTFVYLFSNQKAKIARVAERVAAIIPDDEEARLYASSKFLRTAVMLIEDHKRFQDAEVFFRAAREISDDFGEANEVIAHLELQAAADREADRMREDDSLEPQVVGAILAYSVHKRLGFEFPEDYSDLLVEALATWPQTKIHEAVRACQRRYPNACAFIGDVIPKIIEIGEATSHSSSSLSPSGRHTVATGSGGCVIPVVAIIGLLAICSLFIS